MSLTYRSILILYCIQKLNGERTIYGTFHLLNGKKSSQTIGDANLFDLTFLFGILRPLERACFEKEIKFLRENALIKEMDPSSKKITLTSNGKLILTKELKKRPIPIHLDGWKYNERSQLLWRRLSLLIQVLSNLIDENKRYTPIQQDESISDWVKAYLMRYGHNRFTLADTLYKEVLQSLERVSELEASIFVMRLTSSTRIGYTIEQISSFLDEDEVWCQVLFIHTLHTIIQHVEKNMLHLPILASMIGSHHEDALLTTSTQKTYQLIIEGKTIEEIALVRNLKRNTIEDHIVEVTHQQPNFTIEPFVSLEHQQLILAAYKELHTKQLRPLKEKLPDGISYFEIRLVLARFGGKHESY
ncbi:helix-turn-helix domain-containing protein [Bacillus sinesaloumensis]|uniref:helix-turn-helix domain-containing protein n=1 Tax=Litchfieldia sinesaloumensis TaxID=1926280 RepID=UPI0009883FA7|nr:helix-turn-helix domain-containing protein [Bacillus sinesaloumensis]